MMGDEWLYPPEVLKRLNAGEGTISKVEEYLTVVVRHQDRTNRDTEPEFFIETVWRSIRSRGFCYNRAYFRWRWSETLLGIQTEIQSEQDFESPTDAKRNLAAALRAAGQHDWATLFDGSRSIGGAR